MKTEQQEAFESVLPLTITMKMVNGSLFVDRKSEGNGEHWGGAIFNEDIDSFLKTPLFEGLIKSLLRKKS